MAEIVMPRLSDSMEEGTIIRWLKAEGDEVARGDELVEIETDKATMTYESDTGGVLEIVAREGDTLPVGQLIARLGEGSSAGNGVPPSTTDVSAAPVEDASAVATAAPGAVESEATARPAAAAPSAEEVAPAAPPPAAPPAPAAATAPAAAPAGERVKASPVARRIARERGITLEALTGTGPGGRIVKADVESAAAAGVSAPAAPAPTQPAPVATPAVAPAVPAPVVSGDGASGKGETRVTELTRTQSLIARRMAESRATVPAFTLRATVDMTACVEMRTQLKASGSQVVPSFNDLVVKAAAIALAEHPKANGAYRDGNFEHYSRVNVGVAVAAEGSLVVPTVFDADKKGLAQIAAETRALAERVRTGQITPPELSGGTFTVSNLGMFGVRSFEAVINPPQAAILSVGALEPRPVVRDGDITVRQQMDVELSCDHRILYGADAAQFLARIRQILEAPLALAM